MALLKAGAARGTTPSTPEPPGGLATLTDPDPAVRRRVVRRMAGEPGAVDAMIAHLPGEPDRRVREAIFLELATAGGTIAARGLARLLESGEAELRNGALEALVSMPAEARALLEPLGHEPDPDVRIFAILLAAELPADEVLDWLIALVEDERDANVCSAAVDVLGASGSEDALPALRAIRERFADEPFLAFAADAATACIREA